MKIKIGSSNDKALKSKIKEVYYIETVEYVYLWTNDNKWLEINKIDNTINTIPYVNGDITIEEFLKDCEDNPQFQRAILNPNDIEIIINIKN